MGRATVYKHLREMKEGSEDGEAGVRGNGSR